MSEFKLSGVALYISSYNGELSGSFSVGNGTTTVTHQVSKETASKIKAVLFSAFEDEQSRISEAVANMTRPALIEYDPTKTIESEEVPF